MPQVFPGHCNSGDELGSGGGEEIAALLVAGEADLQGTAIIQSKHGHEALSVDLLDVVAHKHIKGLGNGNGYKFTNIREGADADIEMLHENPSKTVQMAKGRL